MSKKSICLEMIFQKHSFPERIRRVAEIGVETVEFWEWRSKDLDAVMDALDDHGLELYGMSGLGVGGPNLTAPEEHQRAVSRIEESIEVAQQIDCPNLIVLVGDEQPEFSRSSQRNRIIDGLKTVSGAAEAAGVTLLIEPLNTVVDHPGYYLETATEGVSIVEAVTSPRVKLLYDIYHQQITEGNIISTVTEHLEEVGHLHVADVPGRQEPETGELNYSNIIEAVTDAGYEGYVGFEFRPSRDAVTAIESILELP